MSSIKRRHFLQLAGSTLFTLGLSQLEIQRQSLQLAKSMAQSSGRKLALLVGVNRYQAPALSDLSGCVMDVRLMRELLVHRFGFHPDDVLMVTDESEIKPTRAGILGAFETHLIGKAQPGDVVLFHFSGHGNQINDRPECDSLKRQQSNCVVSSLCPSDSFAEGTTLNGGVVNDITGHTLYLLMSKVKTDNFTAVLDSCHSGGGTRGNYVVRSVPRLGGSEAFLSSKAERALQRKLVSEIGISWDDFVNQRLEGIAKGTVIASAQRDQFAFDVPFDDFSAGAFTYTMSRYLWQQGRSETFGNALTGISLKARSQAAKYGDQQLLVEYQPDSTNEEQSFFFTELNTPAAEAVILPETQSGSISFWLGGVSSQLSQAYSGDTYFIAMDRSGNQVGRIRQTSRRQLVGVGEVVEGNAVDLVPGTLLREEILGVPTDLSLKVAIDQSLAAERDEVRQVLDTFQGVEVVPLGQSQSVDYIVGRLDYKGRKVLKKAKLERLPQVSNVGLYDASYTPLTDSFDPDGRPAVSAVKGLRQKLKSLLATRILQLTGGNGNSELKVAAKIRDISQNTAPDQPRAIIATRRVADEGLVTTSNLLKPFHPGTQVQIDITNYESKNLYISAFVIDSDANLSLLYPLDWEAPEAASLVGAGESRTFPQQADQPFEVYGPAGTFELMILASRAPLRNTLRSIQRIAQSRGIAKGLPMEVSRGGDFDDVLGTLLGDLGEQRRTGMRISENQVPVDGRNIAILSTVLEVTD